MQVSVEGILSNELTAVLQGVLPTKTSVAAKFLDELVWEHELIAIQHTHNTDKKYFVSSIKMIYQI